VEGVETRQGQPKSFGLWLRHSPDHERKVICGGENRSGKEGVDGGSIPLGDTMLVLEI
jgi:hypothetical protein